MTDDEKVAKYLDLASAICMEHYSQTEIISAIIGLMLTMPKRLATIMNEIGIPNTINRAQIPVITSISRIFHAVLSL